MGQAVRTGNEDSLYLDDRTVPTFRICQRAIRSLRMGYDHEPAHWLYRIGEGSFGLGKEFLIDHLTYPDKVIVATIARP